MSRRQYAEQLADEQLAWSKGRTLFTLDKSPRYEEMHPYPDPRVDRDACRKWIIAALLAGYAAGIDGDHPAQACVCSLDEWIECQKERAS